MMNKFIKALGLLIVTTILCPVTAAVSQNEILNSIGEYNMAQLEIAKKAKGKLQDMQLRAYNNRLLSDQLVIAKSLEDVARQLGHEVTTEKFKAGKLTENDFTVGAYLEKVSMLHQGILKKIEEEFVPQTNSPQLKAYLQNLKPRINILLNNAKSFKRDLKKP